MKQHPILFSTPMVSAIMEDRKGMTRRIVKLPKDYIPGGDVFLNGKFGLKYQSQDDAENPILLRLSCPYGQVGDILYVRETVSRFSMGGIYAYKADKIDAEDLPIKWIPSIHMPKSAARIWLEITDIRVERAQEISEGDAQKEGVEQNKDGSWWDYIEPNRLWQDDAKASFISLWMKINGKESWDANPWVWVLSFKVLSKTGKPNNI